MSIDFLTSIVENREAKIMSVEGTTQGYPVTNSAAMATYAFEISVP